MGPTQRIDYQPFISQQRFHDLADRFKGFSGPVGSGKSKALVAEALRLAYENPGCMGLIGAPTYPMLRDVTRAAFLTLVEQNGIPYRFHKADNAVALPEPKSEVIFRSLDSPERLVGTNLAWFGVDELTYCKVNAWERLEARLREPKANRLVGFAAWTPKGFDWVYRRFLDTETKVTGYGCILARPGENKALPTDFYERLKHSYDQRFYQQEVLGEYLNIFTGRAYYAFDRAESVKPLVFDPWLPLSWTLDFNLDPMCSLLAQIDRSGVVRVLDELVIPRASTYDATNEFLERTKGWAATYGRLRVEVYGDPAGSAGQHAGVSDWQIVREFLSRNADKYSSDLNVRSANPTQRDRVAAVNAKLKNHAGERSLFIDPRCRELIADLEQVGWSLDTHGNTLAKLDKSDPKRSHTSDALAYLVEKEFGLRLHGGPRSTYIGV
jgi:hypothetical protein